jgi:hypothetical protein
MSGTCRVPVACSCFDSVSTGGRRLLVFGHLPVFRCLPIDISVSLIAETLVLVDISVTTN